jgi:hypothetical protein
VRSDQIRSDRHPFLLVGRASTRPRHGIRLLDDTGRRAEREYAAARPAPPRHPWPPGSGGYAAEGDHPKDYAGVGRRGEKLDLWANMPARTSAFAPRAVEHGWGTDADAVPRCPRSTTGTGGGGHRPSLSCTAPGRSPSAGVQPRHRSHNHTKQITRRMEVEPTANLIYKSGSLEREPKGNCYFTTTPSRRRDHTCDPSATRHQDKRSFDSNADLSIAFARCLVAVECLIN